MLDKAIPPRTLKLNAADNVAVAVDPIDAGVSAAGVTALKRIPRGHKIALVPIAKDEPIRKFGQIIGFATLDIPPGEWVHEHNTGFHAFERDYAYAAEAKKEFVLPVEQQATFQGFRRKDGRAGTRNYVGILTSVNCSASAARFMAEEVKRSGILADYPNVDGVIALTHGTGCGIDYNGESFEVLKRNSKK